MKFKIPHMKVFKLAVAFVAALGLLFSVPLYGADLPGEEGSDLWIESKLMTTYMLNEYLSPFDLDADVEEGVVRLTGNVESSIERELAEQIARGVTGVKSVVNDIEVFADGQKPPIEREDSPFLRSVKDSTITAKVKSNLLWNENTEGLQIDVETEYGVVNLSGYVNTETERKLALQIAAETSGVSRVEDQLKVSPEAVAAAKEKSPLIQTKRFATDAWITTKVKTTLMFNQRAEGADIDVSTENGVVTLDGTVLSPEQKERILELVEDVVNVKAVRDRLRVVM